MASAVTSPASVKLFYSYAHHDEDLCVELQKHLTALKRAGLISDWYDGKIEPGGEWAADIQQAIDSAAIILLLISADFLASKYICEIELPMALSRHDSGQARVIPILLRPVEWHDLPFARLQVLPSHARPVTSWPNQDQAFSDIAGRLRELLYAQRIMQTKPAAPAAVPANQIQERVFDSAVGSTVVIDEPTDIVMLLRTSGSEGLKAILRLDRTYSASEDDVRSKAIELEFKADAAGELLPATLGIELESPGFDPPRQSKQVRVPSAGDSDVFVFMLTPKKIGLMRLNLQVMMDEVVIGSKLLVTRSVLSTAAQKNMSYAVVTMPIAVSSSSNIIDDPSNMTEEATPIFLPDTFPNSPVIEFPSPSAKFEPPAQEALQPQVLPPEPAPPIPEARNPVRPAIATRRSSSKWWIGIGSSAAAIALVTSGIFYQRNAAPPDPVVPDLQQPAPVVREEAPILEKSIANLRIEASAIEKESPDVKVDPEGSSLHKSLNLNLEKAEAALRAKQFGDAQIYMRKAQEDLTSLKQKQSGRRPAGLQH